MTRTGVQLVETLYLSLGLGSCICQALGWCSTLLSGGPLGEAPGSGAGNTQLLIRNLWQHQGTQEEPLPLQGASLMEGDTPKVRSLAGLSAEQLGKAQGAAPPGLTSALGLWVRPLAEHVRCCYFR